MNIVQYTKLTFMILIVKLKFAWKQNERKSIDNNLPNYYIASAQTFCGKQSLHSGVDKAS